MIKIIILLITPYLLFALYNPYKELATSEKINILVNYFLNQELRTKLDKKPIKDKIDNDGPINPTKYERYFNYIQRLKAINEERIIQQQNIDDKYAGEVGYYNGKLKNLQKFYNDKENILPILQHSFNKAFKLIYGKPKIKNLNYSKKENKIYATIWVDDIYGFSKWDERNIEIIVPPTMRKQFLDQYRTAKVNIEFNYVNNIVTLKDIIIKFDQKHYKGNFTQKQKYKIKLNIKIDDDIFKPIKINMEKK